MWKLGKIRKIIVRMVAIFKMSAKTHQNFKVLQFQRKLIFYLEDFRPEECDSDKYDFKMVAIAAIMVAIFLHRSVYKLLSLVPMTEMD
jgi:hypothetical protein